MLETPGAGVVHPELIELMVSAGVLVARQLCGGEVPGLEVSFRRARPASTDAHEPTAARLPRSKPVQPNIDDSFSIGLGAGDSVRG